MKLTNSNDKMYGFRFFKTVLGFLFKLYYNPKTIGAENIPENGSILVVGNHVHIMDQCLPILATKRPVHYMAKREYFDNKKVAWFFKLAGCIPVDRSVKDNNATEKALEVLNGNMALGLFPEGTRNGLKKEKIASLYEICKNGNEDFELFTKKIKKQKASFIYYLEELVSNKIIKKKDMINNITRANDYLLELVDNKVITRKDYEEHLLLPFKFGAVSLAKKTDSYLVPFAITGKYKFRSKDLTVRIGKPFKVTGDLESANKKLAREVVELMKESIKNSGK